MAYLRPEDLAHVRCTGWEYPKRRKDCGADNAVVFNYNGTPIYLKDTVNGYKAEVVMFGNMASANIVKLDEDSTRLLVMMAALEGHLT